ncbi:MAG: glycosyltransferase family 2 protein [archaeon]
MVIPQFIWMCRKMKKVSIIIVNWNGKKFLKNCLTAVFKQTYKNFDVYFVDNGSIDESSDYVKKNFPKVKIVQLDKNYGFAKGNNEGIKEAFKDKKMEYIVCLNNDTIVDKNWLKELVKTAESDKKIGMVSSKAYYKGGKIIQNAGFSLRSPFQMNTPNDESIGCNKNWDYFVLKKDIEIFCPGGVAPLYKRKMLEELFKISNEFFDETFFAYAEDFDIGYRGRLFRWKAMLSANATLIHLHSQTFGKASEKKTFYIVRNSFLVVVKNYSFFNLINYPFSFIFSNFVYFFKKNESFENIKAKIGLVGLLRIVIKSHLSAINILPFAIAKRIKIQKNKKVSTQEIKSWNKKFNVEKY